MTRHLPIASAAALLLAVMTDAAAAQPTLPARIVERIDSVFAQYDHSTSPGCAAAIVRDGQTVFEKGYGMADLQHGIAIAPTSVFNIASTSKQFTAMAIVLLARDGRLSLDDDIRTHLPEVPDFGQRITIRHLIHHTSGLRDQGWLLELGGWRQEDPQSEADILWLVSRQRTLNFAPGSEFAYSNTGYTLLGRIVQRVSGKTLRQFTTERIFAPLGMTNTRFHDDHRTIIPGRTSAYAIRPGRAGGPQGGAAAPTIADFAINLPVSDHAGATSLFTTVQDMAKWEQNFLRPAVGDSAVLAQMYQRGKLTDDREIPYAFALIHGQLRGLETIGHSGALAGYRADFLRIPSERHAFITLCNLASADPVALNRAMAEAVLEERMQGVRPAAAPPTPVPIDAAAVRRFAGVYLDRKTDDVRMVRYHDSTDPVHPMYTLHPPLVHVGDNVFAPNILEPRRRHDVGLAIIGPTGQQARYRFTSRSVTDLETSRTYEKVAPPATAPTALAEFAGRYRSEELDVEWTVAVDAQGTVTLARRRFPPLRIKPHYADGFDSPIGYVRFTRGRSGKVDGLLLTNVRVRHVRFERVAR